MSTLRALTMPKWGIEMVEGTLSDWSIAEGDRIVKGQSIALIETGKIANDVEAELDATVARLVASRGDTLPVGALLAVLATAPASASEVDEFVKAFRAAPGSAAATQSVQTSASAQLAQTAQGLPNEQSTQTGQAATASATPTAPTGASNSKPAAGVPSDVDISPAARALAEERGIDLRTIRGSGRGGRISLQDVERVAKSMPQPAAQAPDEAPTIERFSPMRKAIAQQLTLAKSTIPHFYLRIEVNVEALVSLREQRAPAPGINAWLLRASALALMDVPELNIQVHGEEIHRFKHAHIAVAVATDRGLVAPVIRAAETKSVHALAAEVKALADRARTGALRAEDLQGGSFSVSNLGMQGIDEFDAIINPPQGAILAIGAARRRPIEAEGTVRFATTIKLSLSCDHRAIDGAMGARYLAALRDLLEQPARLS
jgi:pyruvate dehydrogenase E2 component (dihydrolipoamide acetyltransferase)